MSSPAILPPREDGYSRKKWTVDECRFLVNNGLIDPVKFELIEGELVSKMGQGRIHIAVVTRLVAVLSAIFGRHAVQSQAQIGIGELDAFNDPEPDAAVLKGSVDDYLDREPDPVTEVLLIVEASNTSLRGDTTTKAAIYARSGIAEYWVIAIPTRTLIVHRQPTAEGYAEVRAYGEAESVSPLAAPEAAVRVTELLP